MTVYVQSWKLLSDIGQCLTKFGKCLSKSNFDRTMVRSQKKIVTYIFLLWQNPIANSLNLHFAIKFTRHSSILLNVAPEWLYILVSWLIYYIYILWCILYMSDQIWWCWFLSDQIQVMSDQNYKWSDKCPVKSNIYLQPWPSVTTCTVQLEYDLFCLPLPMVVHACMLGWKL